LYHGGGSTAATNLNNYRRTPHHDDNYDWTTGGASILKYNDNRSQTLSIGSAKFAKAGTANPDSRSMAQGEMPPREAAPVRKVVQISTMVHAEKDWAFIALCDDGSLWLYHGSWWRIESVPQTADL
jgi:hypothetical protein